MKRERFEQRLFRVFAQAGYSPSDILEITPEDMVEIPDITVPNIRAVLYVQRRVQAEKDKTEADQLIDLLLKAATRGKV